MHGFLIARGLFVSAFVYATVLIHPLDAHFLVNAGLGLVLALPLVFAESRLRDAEVTHILGGLIGAGIGLMIARTISSGLFWANTGDAKVRFVHFLILFSLPYLLGVLGVRMSEWLKPAKFAALFRGETRAAKQYRILDTSVIIDGRIADIADTGFLDGGVMIPQFVLKELQFVADSADGLKRNRGRRGLDVLQRIQKIAGLEVVISDVDFPNIKEVDLKLIELARTTGGKIVTNDFNLNKVAQLRGVDVLNINELANSLKPVVLPGEAMNVFILKEGKEHNQGVAYLDDGTMVVVDNARKLIGRNVDVVVTSVLQTTAGRMIFGRGVENGVAPGDAARDDAARRARPAQA